MIGFIGGVGLSDLVQRLNLERSPRSWRGDCPACGYPRAFAVKQGRQRQPVLFCANGCHHPALRDAVSRIVGGEWTRPEPGIEEKKKNRDLKQAAALRLWNGSEAAYGTLAEIYLTARGLPGLATSTSLRYRPDARHPEGGRHPALIALVQDEGGNGIAVHRTYLARDGRGKASIAPPRASLGPVWGGAIRLAPPAWELVVGEGIETAASASQLLRLPAWAAISACNMAKGLALPAEVRSVVIASDPDDIGLAAASSAARRFLAEGRRVRIARPHSSGDFNDLIRESAHAGQ